MFHYCDNLLDVFPHYSRTNNRFFEIQILGKYANGNQKNGTTSFRIIKELSAADIEKASISYYKTKTAGYMKIEELHKLQQQFPEIIIGGSVGLFLKGYWLNRFKNWNGDFDIVSPYWIDFSIEKDIEHVEDEKNSGNDFEDTFVYGGVKMDVRVDPHARYEVVTYNGKNFKIARPIDTIAAKVKYATQKGGSKHLKDIEELMSQNKV